MSVNIAEEKAGVWLGSDGNQYLRKDAVDSIVVMYANAIKELAKKAAEVEKLKAEVSLLRCERGIP